jgi:predicted regulator of Ras-like GTPase activity (Roadblock/LC7/MglB family)
MVFSTEDTRQSELEAILGGLADELPDPHWVALVDLDGLVLASVPADPEIETDRISAMTAVVVLMSERVLGEIEGGRFRYITVGGSRRLQLTVALNRERLLSVGLNPDVPPHVAFKPLSRWGPKIIAALQARYREA